MDLCVGIEGQEDATWADWMALAAACEDNGIARLYGADHYLSTSRPNERAALDIWGTLCALGAVTSRLRFGSFVSPVSFRHPSVLAKLAVTADHVSGARIELGMGAGWYEEEHRALGFPFPDLKTRMDIFEEQVAIVRGLLGPAPFAFRGAHYTSPGYRRCPSRSAAICRCSSGETPARAPLASRPGGPTSTTARRSPPTRLDSGERGCTPPVRPPVAIPRCCASPSCCGC
jgi:alkanesulfonate monooxygenase SsuD/methylene tetrahydromethanopterin reductase-like flavin-dependent oxidoreductase (luciferase family)